MIWVSREIMWHILEKKASNTYWVSTIGWDIMLVLGLHQSPFLFVVVTDELIRHI